MIVVDRDAPRREEVADAFRAAGCRVRESPAALDAVYALDDSRTHFWLVAIADTSPTSIADDLRAYLKTAYPRILQIAIGTPDDSGEDARISVDSRADLLMQVHHLVCGRDQVG